MAFTQEGGAWVEEEVANEGLLDKLSSWIRGDVILQTSGLGGVEYSRCDFTIAQSDATRLVQEFLRSRGAANLKVDGKWGPCTQSAFFKVFGKDIDQSWIQDNLGVSCKSLNKPPVQGACTDGTDAVVGPPMPTTPPSVEPTSLLSLFQMKQPLTKKRTLVSGAANLRVVAPADNGLPGQTVSAAPTMVAGIPDWALGVGLVAVVAGAAYLYKKR